MRILLMLIPYFALGGLVISAPLPLAPEAAILSQTQMGQAEIGRVFPMPRAVAP